MSFDLQRFSADVLVIGSGAAGAMAAIKAHMKGADTLVVTKGPFPSGNSMKALSGYAAAFGHADPRDNTDVHFGDVVRNGIGLCNQKLVNRWVTEICGLTEEMAAWGLDLIKDGNKYHQIPWEGHTYPRMVNHHRVTGKYIMKCLGERAKSLGIRALQHTILGGLTKRDGRVSGGWAINYRSGEIYLISARTVILAFGGIGAMYPFGDNVGAATGEGYGIAFEAGAEAIGIEFGHFLATPIYPEEMQAKFVFAGFLNGLLNESNGRLYNGIGERFMWRKFPDRGEKKHSTEELCRSIAEEIVEGRAGAHGGIYFDASDVPDNFKDHDRYRRVFELAERGGIDLRRQPIEFVTYPHDLVGGIRFDEYGRTNVPGLYAAGEATGGSHGASRFGGSALSDCLVFGAAAGEHAANQTRAGVTHDIGNKEVDVVKDRIGGWTSRTGGVDPKEAFQHIRRIAFKHLNMVRTRSGLQNALSEIAMMRRDVLPRLAVRCEGADLWTGLRTAIEVTGQARLCEMMATAALDRTESRGGYFGGHYRTDYPETNDADWLKNIILFNKDGEIAIRYEDPVVFDHLSEERRTVMKKGWIRPDSAESYAESE